MLAFGLFVGVFNVLNIHRLWGLRIAGDAFFSPTLFIMDAGPVLLSSLSLLLLTLPTLRTCYRPDADCLAIKSGLYKVRRIPYANIREVAAGSGRFRLFNTAYFSPVFTKDVLDITYTDGGRERIIPIAPREREEFLRELELRRRTRGGGLT